MESLYQLACLLNEQSDYQQILQLVGKQVCLLLKADHCLILMVNPRTQHTIETVHQQGIDDSLQEFRFFQNQVSGWIMFNHQPFLSADIRQDDRFKPGLFKNLEISSVVGVAFHMENLVLGTLIAIRSNSRPSFSKSDLDYIQKLATVAAPYLRNVRDLADFFQSQLSESALLEKYKTFGLFGKSEKFMALLQSIEAASRSEVRVLLQGASGTGKELIARAIHKLSARSEGPFVAIDCGTLTPSLVESELFGHVRGAFTGANYERKGLLAEAHMGTAFIDEILNLPIEMQGKLLRVIQEGEVRQVGSDKPLQINVRILASSNQLLSELVAQNQFREDLFYRLYVFPIIIPSLRERPEDIALLAHHYLKIFATQQNKKAESFHPALVIFMKNRTWNGNIRELINFVERLVALTHDESLIVGPEILPQDIVAEFKKNKASKYFADVPLSLREQLAEQEKEIITSALELFKGNQSAAARNLKIPVQTLRYRVKKFRINQDFRQI
jgi:transcriptional regulator with GAF, ATPase, and Fis domain